MITDVKKVKLDSENTKADFGKGWWIIVYCGVMFFFLIGFSIDGLNIVAPAFAEKSGIEYANILGLSTLAGFIGLLAYILIGKINDVIGARTISGVCLIGAGVSYIYWGNSQTILQYGIGLTLVTSFINGAAYIGGGSLVAQWFPKKKGLVNGFTTMGHNLGSAFYVPLISFLIGTYGMFKGMSFTGMAAIVVGIIGLIFVRDTPQERGIFPDNVTKETYEREYFQGDIEGEGTWTIKKLLKTKELWMVSLIVGINQLVTTGVMSQLVIRNVSLGFSQETAVWVMTVCAVIGVVGSYMFGWIDQKMGVKKAILLFLVLYCAALLINITDTMTGAYISIFMIGIAIGASANFMVSLPASVFGRHGFSKVYSVYFPIMNAILMTNYIINAQAIRVTGSLRGAYMIYVGFLIINIFIISRLDATKYNRDYMVEEEILRG